MELTKAWEPVESTADMMLSRRLANLQDGESVARECVAILRARGATFFRFSINPNTPSIVVEGWIEWPDEQGEVPLH